MTPYYVTRIAYDTTQSLDAKRSTVKNVANVTAGGTLMEFGWTFLGWTDNKVR